MSSPSPLTPPALDNLTTLEKVETAALYLRFPRFFVFQEAGFMLPVSLSVE